MGLVSRSRSPRSRQRSKIPEIIQQVRQCTMDVGLILGGSVRYGYERPDSDLDFFGISDVALECGLSEFALISEKNEGKLIEYSGAGFPIHIAYWSRQGFETLLRNRPYMTYPLLDGELIFDPKQIAEPFVEQMRQYFDARPKLKQAWVEQLRILRAFKAGKIDRVKFPQWSDFLRYIEETKLDEI